MSSATAGAPSLQRAPTFFSPGKLGMWLFLGSDAMGFMGLIGLYMVLRISSPDWHNPALDPTMGLGLVAFMTFVLIVSSVTMVTGLAAIQRGSRKGLLVWLGATILGGALFLGLQAYEWAHFIHLGHDLAAAFTAETGRAAPFTGYQGTFFMLTGFHGLHVTIGVIYLSCIWLRAWKGAYSAGSNSPVELAGLYWHFVDLVWIIIFTIVYLIPDPAGGYAA